MDFFIAQTATCGKEDGKPLEVKVAVPSPPKYKDSWLARIMGEDKKYTFKRKFISKVDTELSEHFYYVFRGLEDGVYEAHTEIKSGRNKRTFFKVEKNRIKWVYNDRNIVLDKIILKEVDLEAIMEEGDEFGKLIDESEKRHLEEYSELLRQSEFVGLLELTGSERQVKWGERIRHDHIEQLAADVDLTSEILVFLRRYKRADWWITRKGYKKFFETLCRDIIRHTDEGDKENDPPF